MPKTERCYLKIKKVLKEKKLLNRLEYEMDQIYETVILKNVPIKAYIDETSDLHCTICNNVIKSEFHFCPFCSQRLK